MSCGLDDAGRTVDLTRGVDMPSMYTPVVDFQALLDHLFPFAESMVARDGYCCPFGAAITTEGRLQCHAATDGTETPERDEITELLIAGFKREHSQGSIRACGICSDVTVEDERGQRSGAIKFELETKTESYTLYALYTKSPAGDLVFEPLKKYVLAPRVFLAGR
jgi:hypothetical protein